MKHVTMMAALLLAAAAAGQERAAPPGESEFERKAEEVLRQPLKDVGIMREEAPAILVRAQAAPYSTAGLSGCRDYSRAIAELDSILGPDVDRTDGEGNPLPGRLAEAGAKSVVGMLIPFRGLVREATGAAEADRRLRQALLAGQSRRSYLKGRASARGCRV